MSHEFTDPELVRQASETVMPYLMQSFQTGLPPVPGPGVLVSRDIKDYTQGAYVVSISAHEVRLLVLGVDLQPMSVWVGTAAEYNAQWGPAK